MILLKNGLILKEGVLVASDVLINGENIIDIAPFILVDDSDCTVIDCTNKWIRQGAVDCHVHLREPGYEHKETIKTGTLSAAKGGVTTVFAMPNLIPVPHSKQNLQLQQQIIDKDAVISVLPLMSITKHQKGTELADISANNGFVVGYSDDGYGVNDPKILRQAMDKIKKLDGIICSHAEAIEYSDTRVQEYMAVQTELALAADIKVRYHFCHLSTKESLEYVRNAQKAGVDVSCEATPHHFTLSEQDIQNTNYKMNPPLRPPSDVQAVIDAIIDGTVSIIATDHAPHTEQEKNVDYSLAPNGIIGLETLLPIVYTHLVMPKIITLQKMVELTTTNAQQRFGLPIQTLKVGEIADICVLDINTQREYTYSEIASKSKNSPYIGSKFFGFNTLTIAKGRIVYRA